MSSGPVLRYGFENAQAAIRDPLYVFAVNDYLTATMTDEVIDFANGISFCLYLRRKRPDLSLDTVTAHMC